MKIYKAKVSEQGGCLSCRQDVEKRVWVVRDGRRVPGGDVNIIEIGGTDLTREIRLCDECAVELRELLGDIG